MVKELVRKEIIKLSIRLELQINLTLNARRSKAINSIKVDKSFYLPSGFLKIILDLIICRELFLIIQHNYGYETMNGNTKPWELLGIKASCVHTLKKEI